jgi:REP element-mobilizing transposase RayT
MPRPLRIHVPGGFYHVTLPGNHRQRIFFRPADRRIFEGIVRKVIVRYEARVHAYCWMTNHIHLLIQISDTPLGRIMLRIASRYARIVQARVHTTGHLFERRYHAVLVDEDAYLLTLLRYIHQNPVQAGMVSSPGQYRWSSHGTYSGTRPQSWVTTDFALGMLHRQRGPAISAYLRLMQERVRAEDLAPHPEDARVLGGDRFMEKALGESWRPRSRKSLDELVTEAAVRFSLSIDQIRSASRARRLTMARAWIAHQAVTLRIASICDVARYLGRHEASIRGLMRRHPSADES